MWIQGAVCWVLGAFPVELGFVPHALAFSVHLNTMLVSCITPVIPEVNNGKGGSPSQMLHGALLWACGEGGHHGRR